MEPATLRLQAEPWRPKSPDVASPHKTTYALLPQQPPPPPPPPQQQQQVGLASDSNSAPSISSTAAKLFVGQLPFECDERQLHELFSAYGTVEQIHILRDSNNRSKGAAFVTYSSVEEADAAIFTLHNRHKMLANRMIQVSYAKNSPNISPFGVYSAITVHQMNPTNPVPDIANVTSDRGRF